MLYVARSSYRRVLQIRFGFYRRRDTDADSVPTTAILKINGEKLLQVQDDGGFLKYVACLISQTSV